MALARGSFPKRSAVILGIGIVGASLFFGDAVITPAISVLSAVEGMNVVTPTFQPYVVPLTLVILAILFAVQRFGTGGVALIFGPITAVWFLAIGLSGLNHIIADPEILWAISPHYIVAFLINSPDVAFVTLGAVFLAVTGAEALYADLGHFGKKPIQLAWLFLVLPSLAINYFGQAALVMHDPTALENPFYLMFPDWALIPMVILAATATVIASQAVITGAYSLTQQAIQLGLLPRLRNPAHIGVAFRPDLHSARQYAAVHRSDRACRAVQVIELAGLGLWHLGHRHHGRHCDDGLCGDLARLEVVADRGCGADRAVSGDRRHVPHREPLEGVRRRLGAAGDGRRDHSHDVYVAARQPPAVREVAQAGVSAGRSRGHAGETSAAARGRHGGIPHQRSAERADGAHA
jgi:hypothetical protein